jgi:hypothetical protein
VEPLVEHRGAPGMQLDRDNRRTGGQQRPGDGAGPCAQVDDQVTGTDTGVTNQAPSVART